MSVVFLMVVIFAVSIPSGDQPEVKNNRVYAAEKPAGKMPGVVGKRLRGPAITRREIPVEDPLVDPEEAAPRVTDPFAEEPGDKVAQAGEADPVAESNTVAEGLLAAGVQEEQPQPHPMAALQSDWDLITLDGLVDTYHPEYKQYTCKDGDTYETLAQRFFGDAGYANFLRRNNEGQEAPAKGAGLLIPCFAEGPIGHTYAVQPGDSLWTIAASEYGDGSKWNQIFEANRELLKSPDDLREGLSLVIP